MSSTVGLNQIIIGRKWHQKLNECHESRHWKHSETTSIKIFSAPLWQILRLSVLILYLFANWQPKTIFFKLFGQIQLLEWCVFRYGMWNTGSWCPRYNTNKNIHIKAFLYRASVCLTGPHFASTRPQFACNGSQFALLGLSMPVPGLSLPVPALSLPVLSLSLTYLASVCLFWASVCLLWASVCPTWPQYTCTGHQFALQGLSLPYQATVCLYRA